MWNFEFFLFHISICNSYIIMWFHYLYKILLIHICWLFGKFCYLNFLILLTICIRGKIIDKLRVFHFSCIIFLFLIFTLLCGSYIFLILSIIFSKKSVWKVFNFPFFLFYIIFFCIFNIFMFLILILIFSILNRIFYLYLTTSSSH